MSVPALDAQERRSSVVNVDDPWIAHTQMAVRRQYAQ
jgi:hypothetical protein